MEEKKGTAATRAKNKYAQNNYDSIRLTVKKGLKDKYMSFAKEAGYQSLNSFINEAIEEKVKLLKK